jgi:signal transduction histidine kinase/CheY-like chemotaxis protein
MSVDVARIPLDLEQDVVTARQRVRRVAALLGFDLQDQARLATAVSEIARNAIRYAGRGMVELALEGERAPQIFMVRVVDQGPGIRRLDDVLAGRYQSATGMGLGIVGARRLVDQCSIRSEPGVGTDIWLKKILPATAKVVDAAKLAEIRRDAAATRDAGPLEELRQQHSELLRALAELRERQDQLTQLNRELEDTNRGVVALYAELDQKADHLRRADEMKTRFLSNMSHEFRTPLNSIRALSGILLDHIDGPLGEEQEKQVGFIRKAANDLSQLVEDLLDIAKIEAGKIEVRPTVFSVADLFSALRGMLRPLLVSDAVTLQFDADTDLPEMYTDEAMVSQIVRNFISNALKFTERGEVRVSAELVADGTCIAFAVRDTGIGIAPEHLDPIFQEFVQVQGHLQTRVKGTGLGLPLCRKLASLLDGSVDVKSEQGVGSTFTAVIPLRRVELVADVEGGPAEAPVEPWRLPVLVVEDEPELQLAYEGMLRNSAYRRIEAANLRDAKEAMHKDPPIAIVLDIMLRGEDTWRWLSELKSTATTQRIPIIVISDVAEQRKGFALGADAYVAKPIERAQLLAELDRLTGSRILIIDDDTPTRYMLRRMLESAGFGVIEAVDAASGMSIASASHPTAILLDLGLPDMDGTQLLDLLGEDSRTRDIPVLVATARDLSVVERRSLDRRARAVLTKRELSTGVVAAVSRVLGETHTLAARR